jgi:hypothetical protein
MNKLLMQWFFQKMHKVFVFLLLWSNRKAVEIKGQIIIHSIPFTDVNENTEEMRKLWLGCKIPGKLSFNPYEERTQPSSIKCFVTGLNPCCQALSEIHGEAAKSYIEFWQRWHKNWDDNHQRWVANYRIGCWYGMTFDRQCFFFIPDKKNLSNFQEKIWKLLEYFGNRWCGGFQGVQL